MLRSLRICAWGAAGAWAALLVARGRFWDARPDRLRAPLAGTDAAPDVHAVVPARNEADVVKRTLSALLAQRYEGRLAVTVVNDRSEDGTADEARAAFAAANARGSVVEARPRPRGWSGKVWALAEGVSAAGADRRPRYWWFTDADIEHDPRTLARLVATAEGDGRALVSEMVALHCASRAERLLIPAFVLFFRLLYPFAWVNDDRRRIAAAAGGSVLLRDDALVAIGGVERIKGELIDDCSLAAAVKGEGFGLHLSLSTRSRSVRPYDGIAPLWNMVARTAYTQLRHSPPLLAGTVLGMGLLFFVPLAATFAGARRRRTDLLLPGAFAWGMTVFAYLPTIRLYRVPVAYAATLPLAGLLYTAMTVDSALRHARGRGGVWKGRAFELRA